MLNSCRHRVPGFTSLLSMLFALVEMDFYVIGVSAKVVKAFEGVDHEGS